MGIRGLYRFIFDIPGLVKPYKLHDSYVIIDGTNLYYSLYLDYRIDKIRGGDYNQYAGNIRKYFCTLFECNIKPIVVFDGGHDESQKKHRTLVKRTKQCVSFLTDVAENKKNNNYLLPILSPEVFLSVLIEFDIPFVHCNFEADDQIAALANYYKCPVISSDTDFFIFDVHNGFIVRHLIETNVSLDTESNGKGSYKYLKCYIYYIEDFLLCFPGIEKKVLPLFVTLMGNDYSEQEDFEDFFDNIQLPEENRMLSLLNWLKGKSLSDATNQIIQLSDEETQEYVQYIIEISVGSYDLHDCNLRHIVDQRLTGTKCEFLFDSTLTTPCGNSLPLDFVIKYHSSRYSPRLIKPKIIISHEAALTLQLDDLSCCSSHMCARYIRRVIYGILIRHDVDGGTCHNENCLGPIREIDRHEATIHSEYVQPIFYVERVGMLPTINELSNLGKGKAKFILVTVLGLNLDFFSDLPTDWQLFIACVNYCVYNSVPCIAEEFLYALILNLIYWNIIKRNNPYRDVYESCNKLHKQNHTCSSLSCILTNIDQTELHYAGKKLNNYLFLKTINQENPLCFKILHSYSQLQACILSAISLNNLLGPCMYNPYIPWYLNGSMLYNLTKVIASWPNPNLFVAKTLGMKTNLSTLFRLLYSKICFDVPNHYILKNKFACA